jgi:hypothetical protein
MKRVIVFLLLMLVVLFTTIVSATRTVPLNEIFRRPAPLQADDSHIYVVDFPIVYIYSLTDFSLLTSFGKRGEGPREFKQYINLFFQDVEPTYLVVSSIGKVSFYSRDGKFIKEIKISFGGWSFQPLGEKFIGHTLGGNEKDGYKALNIYDANFNKIKEIYRQEFVLDDSIKKRILFASNYQHWTYRKKIYVVAKNDFIIERFDFTGKRLSPITQEYKRVKCTEHHKKIVLDSFKRDINIRHHYERLKHQIEFPGYFRAIRDIVINEEKIYVLTYKRKDGENEFYIFDIDGKLLQKKFLPIKTSNGVSPRPFTVKSGKLYQLCDNEETENWEFHVSGIN